MSGLDFLEKVDIFKGLDQDQLNAVHKGGREKEYHYGDRLFAEGENADRIWLVVDGQVDLRFDLPGRPTSEENTIFSILPTVPPTTVKRNFKGFSKLER